jgi:dTMP kinase
MDLGLSRDSFDSFIRYQRLIQKEFSLMQAEYGFSTVNGNLSVSTVAREIGTRVMAVLEG